MFRRKKKPKSVLSRLGGADLILKGAVDFYVEVQKDPILHVYMGDGAPEMHGERLGKFLVDRLDLDEDMYTNLGRTWRHMHDGHDKALMRKHTKTSEALQETFSKEDARRWMHVSECRT